jgi:universal stress protein E
MQRFKNILFIAHSGADQSAALKRALALAEYNGARLTVMDVVEPEDELADAIKAQFNLDLEALLLEQRREELAALTTPYAQSGRILIQVRSGTPFIEVIRAVQHNGYDLLIKAAEGPRGQADRLFGSTDMHLLRKAPCPVWIDRPCQPHPYRTILAAVDPVGEAVNGMYRLIMDLATSLGTHEGGVVHVAHAWNLQGESLLTSRREHIQPSYLEHLREMTEARHKARLGWLVSAYDLSLDMANVHLIEGKPAEVIPSLAHELRADVIVLGTAARVGVPGFLIGSTAEEILGSTQCSVLAVKPEGFVSPVTLQ